MNKMDLQSPQKILPNSVQLLQKPEARGWGQIGNLTTQFLSKNSVKAFVAQILERHNSQSTWEEGLLQWQFHSKK